MPGIDGTDKTGKLPLLNSAVQSLPMPGVENTDKTGFASHYGAAPHYCREWACPFRFLKSVGIKIYIVGAGIARPFFAVSSAVSTPGKRNHRIGKIKIRL